MIAKVDSPESTGSTAHPGELAACHWSESCCAGELQSFDWPRTGRRDDTIGGEPDSEGILVEGGTLIVVLRRLWNKVTKVIEIKIQNTLI